MPTDPELPDNLRAFDDYTKARQLIYDNALDSITKKFPISDGVNRLELHNPRYTGKQDFTLKEQKKALMTNRPLHTPIKGTWRLVDEDSGKVLDEKEDVVMHVPYYTQRGTIINNGNEYTVINQHRLKPGVYTRTRKSGEIEAQFNVVPGTGRGFRIWLEPHTGIFRVTMGQSNMPAYPLLKLMGADDNELRKAWGDQIYRVNTQKVDPKALQKMHKFFVRKSKVDPEDAKGRAQEIRDVLQGSKMDPDVLRRTLGMDADHIDRGTIMRATNKILNIHKGDEAADDRDAPKYANVYSVEDFVKERIDKDAGGAARNILFQARRNKNLRGARRGVLNPYMKTLLLGSGLAQPLEETNVMQLYEQAHRLSRYGAGGVGSPEMVTEEARDVNPGQLGFIDLVAGPESQKIGTDTRITWKTFKGNDKQLYSEFRNAKTGEIEYVKPEDLDGRVIAFPGQALKGMVYGLRDGKYDRYPASKVDYQVPTQAHMMSHGGNLTALPTGFMPTRGFFASKYYSQIMPLEKGEAPWVQTEVPGQPGIGFHQWYGRRTGTMNAPAAGIVTKITKDAITISDEEGKKHLVETPRDFPFNRITAVTYKPSVKEGDVVQKGDMVASSNFTTPDGSMAFGRNLKTAVIPGRGNTFEDAFVISESAAQKLATERLFGFDKENRNGTKISRKDYVSLFPKKYDNDQLSKLDERGVILPGQKVNYGDPLILALGPRVLSAEDAELGKLHKVLRNAHRDQSEVWKMKAPGVVTDVGYTSRGVKVNVKSIEPVQPGDKLTNAFASKGVVGKVVPDDQMPYDESDKQPFDVVFNPMTVPSRVAPNQVLAILLGKIAKQTGQPVLTPGVAPDEGWANYTAKQLEAAGISPETNLIDPGTHRRIPSVTDGYMFVMPFHHLAEKKLSARNVGGYTHDEAPARGGHAGAKRNSQLDLNALLAHGAHEVIKDVQLIRGAKNEDYWNALRSGRPLPEPKVPFVYNKFINTLKAGGINVVNKGDVLQLAPITDADIDKLSTGEIKNPETVDAKLQPIKGGLFDPGATGGFSSSNWSHINLSEPIPNPVMEEPIRRLLGLRVKDYLDIISGKQELNGLTGGLAIQTALSKIDVDKQINVYRDQIKSTRGATRDNAVKALRYLSAAKKQGINPASWVITKVPVLPPVFRPVSQIGDMIRVADMNDLYRDVIELNNGIRSMGKELPPEELADEKAQLYSAVEAAFGFGEAITAEGRAKRLKGAVRQVVGSQPKTGLFQRRVLSRNVDVVGRGVVTPDPNLDMDTVGIPEEMAWDLYRPFVIRRLSRRGFPPDAAAKLIEEKRPEAQDMLRDEMADRPVIMDRAPTWHKFNLMAFNAVPIKGDTIAVSPLIVGGFNMDFDGDQASIHVPVSEKASVEAKKKMMPSKNLFKVADFGSLMHGLGKEMTLGLSEMVSEPENKAPAIFGSVAEAKAAYRNGLIKYNDPIIIQ